MQEMRKLRALSNTKKEEKKKKRCCVLYWYGWYLTRRQAGAGRQIHFGKAVVMFEVE